MTLPCPKCRKFDRLVLEQDERPMTEFIRCTRCRRKKGRAVRPAVAACAT
jgi:Zn ribbon nucleic-acid-binding protein